MKIPANAIFINDLADNSKTHWNLIQVILGPRQVGKTTGIQTLLTTQNPTDYHYVSADGQVSRPGLWLEGQWQTAKMKSPKCLLVIDEIQKVENWSETIKKLWDLQKNKTPKMRVIVLGSSSLQIQKGLSESLTGRFQVHKVPHWNHRQSYETFGLTLEEFLLFGGYPGSYAFRKDRVQWLNYVRESIIETVIGKDILNLARVKSPALFRQCFDLACAYGGQEISYTKLLGQLQEKGNVELVKHYLELFEGAFLLKQLPKFSAKKTLSRASSPKLLPLCPALFSVTLDADFDSESRGRAFEIAVGCELARLPGHLSYWREGAFEVDYIYHFGRKVFAIEVKSSDAGSLKGLQKFQDKFPKAEVRIVRPENYSAVIDEIAEA